MSATAPTTHAEYQRQLSETTSLALRNQVPMDAIILELEMMKLYVYEQHSFQVRRAQMAAMQAQAQQSAGKIVVPNGSPAGN